MKKHYMIWTTMLGEKIPGKIYGTELEASNAVAELNAIYASNGFDMEAFYSVHEYN